MPSQASVNLNIAELDVRERRLYHLLLLERVVVPICLVASIGATEGSGRGLFVSTCLLLWATLTSSLAWNSLEAIKAHPGVLLIDLAVVVACFLAVGHWRGDYYLTLAEPAIAAAILFSQRVALWMAAIATGVIVCALGVAGLPDGRGQVLARTVQKWAGPPFLIVAGALILSFVRPLLDDLRELERLASVDEANLAELERVDARSAAVSAAHDDLLAGLTSASTHLKLAQAAAQQETMAARLGSVAGRLDSAHAVVHDLLLELRPVPTTSARSGHDYAVDLAERLESERRGFYNYVTAARFALALLVGAFLYDEARLPRFEWIVALWSIWVLWVLATTAAAPRLYPVLRSEPRWLAVDEAFGIGLLLLGTNSGGNVFWTAAAGTAVIAAAVAPWPWSVFFGAITIAAALASVAVADAAGWANTPSAPGFLLAVAGYFGLAAAVYVAFLLDQLETAANRHLRLRAQLRDERNMRTQQVEWGVIEAAIAPPLQLVRESEAELEALVRPLGDEGEVRSDVTAAIHFLFSVEDDLRSLSAQPGLGLIVQGAAGLREVVRDACHIMSLRQGAATPRLEYVGPPVNLQPRHADVVRRFVIEAAWNAWRHAGEVAQVRARVADGRVTLSVTDGGRGFDPDTVKKGIGLQRFIDDASVLGGTFKLVTGQTGTTATLDFPSAPQ